LERRIKDLNLLHNDNGVIRVPFLIKGKLIAPPEISRDDLETCFAGADTEVRHLKLQKAQIIREPIIDRSDMKYTGEFLYQIMPLVNSQDLIETNINKLVNGPYNLPVDSILDYLESVKAFFEHNPVLVRQVMEMSRMTSEFPDSFIDSWLTSIYQFIDRKMAREMIDSELTFWGKRGSALLNGWVEVAPSFSVRAMPTRQLHITAGNTPEVPVVSALRAILTKSAAVIKMPFGATLTGSLIAVAISSLPQHPVTPNLSLVYWQGGDESIENILFAPNAFDRIVVWGSPDTVNSVHTRVEYTRTVLFNPRYGVSLIGREAFSDDLEKAAELAAADSMIYNQKACNSSLVHYVEGTEEQANLYAGLLGQILRKWDEVRPQFISPSIRGQIKRMRIGKYSNSRWYVNEKEGEFTSGVVVMPDEFDIFDHPMCRLIIVRCIEDLSIALKYIHPGISTVGVYPEERRLKLRDMISAKGASNVLPLGHCERIFAGMPHDGMLVLSQLVDWKNG